MGSLWRWTIWGLAAIFAVVLFVNFTGDSEEVAAVQPEVVLPDPEPEIVEPEAEPEVVEAPVEETVEEAVKEVEDVSKDAVETVAEAVEEAVASGDDDVVATAKEAGAEAMAEAGDSVVEAAKDAMADELKDEAGEELAAVAEKAAGALGDLAGVTKEAPVEAATMIVVPGSDISYSLVNAFRRDNGSIEVTTEQTAGGEGATLWLVTCAPLAMGTIATGASAGELGPRSEDPELTRITLGQPEAMIAATACGVMK